MMTFAHSQRSTLGVEWELGLVDAHSFNLVSRAQEIIGASARWPELANKIVAEMLTNTIEVVTDVHETVAASMLDLKASADILRDLAQQRDISMFCAGTHPFANWREQEVTDATRYAEVVSRSQWWGKQMLIFGVHTHVGIDQQDKVIPIANALLCYLPHLLAVSASSPLWIGEDTGYASNRAMMFQQLPSSGLPFQFESWAEFTNFADSCVNTSTISRLNELRWDIRPVPHLGTIEMRMCDGMSSLREIGATVAFIQCLSDSMSSGLDAGEKLPAMPQWFHVENKFRAARYGMDAVIIVNAEGTQMPVSRSIAETVATLMPTAQRLGCAEELQAMTEFATQGAGYQRQLATMARTSDVQAVTEQLVNEFNANA